MDLKTARTRFMRTAIALALATGLMPALAHGDEGPGESSVVQQTVDSAVQATKRFETTGNASLLRDVRAYESDGAKARALASSSTLPRAYDLRDKGVVTPVKLQDPWRTCWSFGAIAASETSIMSELGLNVNNGDEPLDLSELHTAWFSYMPLPEDAGSQAGEGLHTPSTAPADVLRQGGHPFTATSVFSSGIGPVFEETAPYKNKEEKIHYDTRPGHSEPIMWSEDGDWSVPEDLRFLQAFELEESRILPSPASHDDDGTYHYNPAGTEAIKSEVHAGRAVEIAYCSDISFPGMPSGSPGYINTDTWAHYTYENKTSDHAVTIIGWDDDYPKEKFLHRPPGNGAFIVKNSWGSADQPFPNHNFEGVFNPQGGWGFEGKGVFYLSYHDMSITNPESFDYHVDNLGQDAEYYLINQYDFMPSMGTLALPKSAPASTANVFEASERQRVRSLSCETAKPNTKVTYELYLLNDGFANPRDGDLLYTATETYDYGGYHRIELGEGFIIERGRHFAVVATQQCDDGSYIVSIDSAITKEGMEYLNQMNPQNPTPITSYAVSVVNEGESFLLEDGAWSDWTRNIAKIKEETLEEMPVVINDYDNFPLKAYSDPVDEPKATVPDLSGMTEAEALAALEQANLEGQAGDGAYSDTVEKGCVITQDVQPGTEVDQGTLVTFRLSLGPATVPAADAADGPDGKALAPTGDAALFATAAFAALLAGTSCAAAARSRRKRSRR